MDDMNNRGSGTATIEKKALQPRLIIQALAFTAILYFCVGQTPPNTSSKTFQSVESSTTLSATVRKSVLQYASQQSRLPISDLRIIHAQPQTWSDSCLELGDSGIFCTQRTVPGWQVTVASRQQLWIYRTDTSGSVIKLEDSSSSAKQGSQVAISLPLPAIASIAFR